MLILDEVISNICCYIPTNPGRNFLECKSVFYYIDEDVNPKNYDSLKNKIKNYYKDRKDIKFKISSFNEKKTIVMWIIMNFNEKQNCSTLTDNFQKEFEQTYKNLKKIE